MARIELLPWFPYTARRIGTELIYTTNVELLEIVSAEFEHPVRAIGWNWQVATKVNPLILSEKWQISSSNAACYSVSYVPASYSFGAPAALERRTSRILSPASKLPISAVPWVKMKMGAGKLL